MHARLLVTMAALTSCHAAATPASAPLSSATAPKVVEHTSTVAGDVSVVELAPLVAYDIRNGDKVILHADQGDPRDPHANASMPKLVKSLGAVAPYDEVLLYSWPAVSGAAACATFGYTFVGLKRDGTSAVSEAASCSFDAPTIDVKPARVTLTFPEGKSATGTPVAASAWTYEAGTAREQSRSAAAK